MFKSLIELWKSLDNKAKNLLKAGLFSIIVLGFISILILPLLFTLPSYFGWMDFTKRGSVGDTINGISGPFIAIIASVLTFFAFYIQYQANIQQRNQFIKSLRAQNDERKAQEKVWRIERFENKFYELLKLHKSNVEEMRVARNISGRSCFVPMFYELRFCYQIVKDFHDAINEQDRTRLGYNEINLMNFSYRIFFFGIGINAEKYFVKDLNKGENNLFGSVKPFMETIQRRYSDEMRQSPGMEYFLYVAPNRLGAKDKQIELYYIPFKGHAEHLGHYYRHLYQISTYIIDQDILNKDEKYGYIKTLRAQLSNFEQLLLYYNSLAWFDKEWHELFTTYRLIKNLPLSLADFHEIPEEHYLKEIEELLSQGIHMFEWLED